MPKIAMSRRTIFEVGGSILAATGLFAGTAGARAGEVSANEAVVRNYFKSWEKNDWAPFDAILADDFTFTSPNGDDHIGKSAFKTRCWDSQIGFIVHFDLELLMVKGDDVLVKYLCHVKNGKTFGNVEYHRLVDQKIAAIECYFGQSASFASAVGSKPT